MTLTTHNNKNALLGEICIGFFSEHHIDEFVTWETKRQGKQHKKGTHRGKYPLFIQRNEAIDKGWSVW